MSNEMSRGMLAGVENLWTCFDELLDSLRTPEDWAQKHGDDWTFADIPYHMMYTNRDLVAGPLRRGREVPDAEQKVQRTVGELNAWNAAKFAQRPTGQAPAEALAQWRAGRENVRHEIGALQDEDLMSRLVWFPLPSCGWVPAMVSAGFAVAHTWSEFVQLRHIMGHATPVPDPMAVHTAIGFLQGLMPGGLNRGAAEGANFTAVLEYTGPGGESWTVRVSDGAATVAEEREPQPDLIIIQSPETFELVRQGKLNPAAAMQSGALKAVPMEQMATFGTLFPPPSLDTQIAPMGVGALG